MGTTLSKKIRSVTSALSVTTSLKWLSPSTRHNAKRIVAWFGEQLNKACFWNWEVVRFPMNTGQPYNIIYIGRKINLNLAKALINVSQNADITTTGNGSDGRVIVSEIPFPGSMCVPSLLNSIVPLGRPIDEITANFHSQLRRNLKKNRRSYRLRQVLDNAEIEQIDREMLRPYAIARHGMGAAQVELDEVKRGAQEYGRLDLLLLGDEVVGCQLSHDTTRLGKRYWSTSRCGYTEAVFSDPKRLRDINSFNIYLAMEWAIVNDFDYYDIGVSLGRPGDGLLEWKRRRGGELSTLDSCHFLYIWPPKLGKAQFFWDAPLFEVDHHKLTLHLGLPDGPSDEEVNIRHREMGFRGLSKIYLHCARLPAEQLLETLQSFYAHQKNPPVIEIVVSK